MTYFFSQQNAILYSLIVKTGDYQCMALLKRWFKTSARPWKVHSKWNSTLNRHINVEPVTTTDGWFKNKWEAVKSPSKMIHWTRICDYSERLFLTLYFVQFLTSLLLSLLLLFADIVGIVYHLLFIVIIVVITIFIYRS